MYMHCSYRKLQCLFGIIDRTPDLYLDELIEVLFNECGKVVSKSTVWRALQRGGFTMKKVHRQLTSPNASLIPDAFSDHATGR